MSKELLITILSMVITMAGTGIAVIAFVYQFLRNFKADINEKLKEQDAKFNAYERRFEKMDQRLFLLCLGKDLPSILKSEREEEK